MRPRHQVSHENIVWGFSGVNYYGTNTLYSAEPLSVFGPVKSLFSPSAQPDYKYWFWTNKSSTPSGGYALGTSYNLVTDNGNFSKNWTTGYHYVQTTSNLNVHGANCVYLDMDAEFELSNGGEGVIVFLLPAGSSKWYWVSPTIGYPGNVNVSGTSLPNNFIYPQNSASLVPAFTTVSGGEYLRWIHYTFNLTPYMTPQTSSVSLMFVLIINGKGYNLNVYGNDFFVMDNVKVSIVGTVIGSGQYTKLGDVWNLSYDPNVGYYMNSSMYPKEMDQLVSVPISFNNLMWAKMDFYTEYNILARFANANDPTDVPNGFNLYVGTLNPNGGINWFQLDTNWAGEAGIVSSWTWASTIPSVYYSNTYAFHQTGININLTGFIGNAIYIKFFVHGDTDQYYSSTLNLVQQISGNDWVALTNVIIIGYSPIGVVSVQSVWF